MSAMRIAVLGGGPGGLYFAALAKQLDARHDITVWERNAADDTFGFGVVFSDETLGGIEHADEEIFAAMQRDIIPVDIDGGLVQVLADPRYAVLTPDDAANGENGWGIVEGTVVSASSNHKII